MRLLLTSAGITHTSIHDALVELLGKPIAESSALCIPTASYAMPGGAGHAWRLISGRRPSSPMCELGWKSLGVLELTALPSIDQELWVPMVRETDALLVGGGDALYLCYWMRQSGLADLLPSLGRETVYVGFSINDGKITQEIAVGELDCFEVVTQFDHRRWMVRGTTGRIKDDAIPVDLTVQCFVSPESNETATTQRNLKLDGTWSGNMGAIGGIMIDQSARRRSNKLPVK
jgi:hypothetical protein